MEQISTKKKRGRPYKIAPLAIEITKLWQEGKNDKDIRWCLEQQLTQLIKDINEVRDIEDLPSLYSIGDFRRKELERNPESDLDNPWHLGTLNDDPLPADAIPHILLVQAWAKKNTIPLTIRNAIWISRLYKIKEIKNTEALFTVAGVYSIFERRCELAGLPKPYNTSNLDAGIIDGTCPKLLTELFTSGEMATITDIYRVSQDNPFSVSYPRGKGGIIIAKRKVKNEGTHNKAV